MDCPACSSPSAPWAACPRSGKTFHLCPSCGLVSVDRAFLPNPEEEQARYFLHRNSADDPGFRSYLGNFSDAAIRPFLAPGASVLDYGSGPEPVLSRILSASGYRVFSWDPFFAPVRPGTGERFDAVILHEVIEHCVRPLDALADAASFIDAGGVISVSTLWRPETPEGFLSWWYREDPSHISFFSRGCLEGLARRIGLSTAFSDERSIAVFRKG